MSHTKNETPGTAATQAHATSHGVKESATVTQKLPPFWSTNPQVWFAQVESQFFTLQTTNQDTKFHNIVASLPLEVEVDIHDLVINKLADNAHDELKKTR